MGHMVARGWGGAGAGPPASSLVCSHPGNTPAVCAATADFTSCAGHSVKPVPQENPRRGAQPLSWEWPGPSVSRGNAGLGAGPCWHVGLWPAGQMGPTGSFPLHVSLPAPWVSLLGAGTCTLWCVHACCGLGVALPRTTGSGPSAPHSGPLPAGAVGHPAHWCAALASGSGDDMAGYALTPAHRGPRGPGP